MLLLALLACHEVPDKSAAADDTAVETGGEETGAEETGGDETGGGDATPVLADYDAEPREAAPRDDGYTHVDSATLVDRLVEIGVNTYAFLIYHSPSDWDDLTEYLALAEPAGLESWVYLVPPAERPAEYPPYEGDYVAWAGAIGALAAEHPSITAIAMDDFNGATDLFTGDYVCEMMDAAHAYAPDLKSYAVDYYPYALVDLAKEADRACVDGVVFPYMDLDSNADFRAQIDQIAAMRQGLSDALTLTYPWDLPSTAGASGRFTATCGPGELRFSYNDDFVWETAGYHMVRVREDGDVLFEEDVAEVEDDTLTTLTLAGGEVSVGLEEDLGVYNFGVEVYLAGFDAPSCGEWTFTATDDGFDGSFTDVEGWTDMDLIPMVYATSTSWHPEVPSTETVTEAVEIALEAWRDGATQGVITYCMDKTAGSEQATAVGEIYRR